MNKRLLRGANAATLSFGAQIASGAIWAGIVYSDPPPQPSSFYFALLDVEFAAFCVYLLAFILGIVFLGKSWPSDRSEDRKLWLPCLLLAIGLLLGFIACMPALRNWGDL